jgi:pyruvate dehydrogenase E2 component (dihydrolipoamide acetyltransferase)
MHKIIIPRFDPAMKTGKIIKWLKSEGETVNKGEPLLIVEGEKTVFEVEAPANGILRKILYQAGSEVEVLKPIALIGEVNEPIPQELIEEIEKKVKSEIKAETIEKSKIEKTFIKTAERVKASPLAKKLAEEYGINIEEIKGTGPGGRITKEDVLNAVKKASLELKPTLAEASISGLKPIPIAKTIPLSRTRKTIAERLVYSLHKAASTTIITSVNLENLLKYREEIKSSLSEVSLTAFIVKATAKALETHPIFNSTLNEEEIKIFEDINIALAIHTEEGLVTPVIKNANKKSIIEISNEIKDLTNKAFQRKLSIDELTGGTFTITNLGAYDVELFIPIINPPQTGILGVGKIEKKPIVVNDQILIKPTAALTLVFDHRVVDGVPAAKFLQEIKHFLENPKEL